MSRCTRNQCEWWRVYDMLHWQLMKSKSWHDTCVACWCTCGMSHDTSMPVTCPISLNHQDMLSSKDCLMQFGVEVLSLRHLLAELSCDCISINCTSEQYFCWGYYVKDHFSIYYSEMNSILRQGGIVNFLAWPPCH